MKITAKFASTCPGCHRAINAGDKIEWSKGNPAVHDSTACLSAAPAPKAARSSGAGRYRSGSRSGRSGAGAAALVRGYSSYCTGRDDCGCYDCAS